MNKQFLKHYEAVIDIKYVLSMTYHQNTCTLIHCFHVYIKFNRQSDTMWLYHAIKALFRRMTDLDSLATNKNFYHLSILIKQDGNQTVRV